MVEVQFSCPCLSQLERTATPIRAHIAPGLKFVTFDNSQQSLTRLLIENIQIDNQVGRMFLLLHVLALH
jgi:hypothetical protein